MFEPLPAPAADREIADPYLGVALGVECAWPLAAIPTSGLPTEAPDPIPSSSP
jgi:hypothetical protein